MTKITDIAKARLQVVSTTGDGMNVEICGEADNRRFNDGSLNPIAWFRADIEGEIKFVVSTPQGLVAVRLEELERAIECAKLEVHSEGYYELESKNT
jgi:hypothetical protein